MRRALRYLVVVSLLVLVPTFATAQGKSASQCSVADVKLEDLRARKNGGLLSIVGRIVNNCGSSTGVEIKITTYDAQGSILTVDDLWPASTSNIQSKSDFPFEWYIEMDRVKGFARFEGRIIRVSKWD